MKKSFQFLLVLMILFGLIGSSIQPVIAAPLSSITFSECPTYEELHDAVINHRIINFDLAKTCRVSFDREIVIEGYAILRNVGPSTVSFDGNGQDLNEDNDSIFFNIDEGSLRLENIEMINGAGANGGAIVVRRGNLALDYVTIKNCAASGSGGAIYFSSGDLDIRDSSFIDNHTEDQFESSSGSGGAIYFSNFAAVSRVFILNSTFDGNHTGDSANESSGRGGAIYVSDIDGTLLFNIFNSTFYANRTGSSLFNGVGDGGAIYVNNYGGTASTNIYHSTFSTNATGTTWSGTLGDGQTIFLRDATLNMAGSIMGNSISSTGGNGYDCDFSGDASISDGGFNLIENMGDCREYFPRSIEADPGLNTTVAANGGATQTIALNDNSQAIDQIPVGMSAHGINLCGYDYADFDQRGEGRPGNEKCDIGAYEVVDEDHPYNLPATGFPEGQVTQLTSPRVDYPVLNSQFGGMTLVIPKLGVETEIVGVPEGWNVEWLGNQVGYLHGTTYPTWQGNSVLTGHAVNHFGKESVFADLKELSYNDRITIEAWGQEYVYAVRERFLTTADDLRVLENSNDTQLTLITCTGYDPISMTYPLRQVIVAVLVAVH